MVTGDNTAIAREIAGQLGLGKNIQPATALFEDDDSQPPLDAVERIKRADGFAQVFPEHKYGIVKSLQERNHLVAMAGDGVNDAARAAADLILTAPGLSITIQAIEEARRIFEHMNAYAIYRITETIRIMIFMVAAMLAFNSYPITAIMIILLALLNDLPIMAIAVDNTWLDPRPVRWEMHRVLTLATLLGLIGVAETFLLLIIVKSWLALPVAVIQTVIFLKLSIAGHLTLSVARTKRPMFTRPFPAPRAAGSHPGHPGDRGDDCRLRDPGHTHPMVVHRPDLGLLSDPGIHRGLVQARGVPALSQDFSAPSELSRDTRRQSAYPRPLKPDFRVTR